MEARKDKMGAELSIERFIKERDELRGQLEDQKDKIITRYNEAMEDYYKNKGLSQESFYEGMCSGLAIALGEIGCDEEDIAQLQEGVREDVEDEYAERKFFEEHGYYPDADVNR